MASLWSAERLLQAASRLCCATQLTSPVLLSSTVPKYFRLVSTTCARLQAAKQPKPSTLPQASSESFRTGYSNLPSMEKASEDIRKMFSLEFASKREWNKERAAQIVTQLQRSPGDTGSTPVQIGALSVRVEYLKDHMRSNKKDKHTLRSLLRLIHRRRKLLVYLRRKDFTRYHQLLSELQLKPVPEHRFLKKN